MLNQKNNLLIDNNSIFGKNFNNWRIKKCQFLIDYFGINWFKNKKILEVGCGFGHIGLFFKSLGGMVDFSDGRLENLYEVKNRDNTVNVYHHNYEEEKPITKYYDLIIHFGVLYHLNYWEKNLKNVINHCSNLVLDTAVNKYNGSVEFKIINFKYEHEFHGPINGIGTLTSAKNIEKIFDLNNLKYQRFDNNELNTEHFYDWESENYKNDGKIKILNDWCNNKHYLGNRFWIISN